MRKLNLYLGFPPAKRANPIRSSRNLRVPISRTERPVQGVYPLHHPVAKQRLSRLYGANTGAERVVIESSYLSNDLVRVVTLYTAVMPSGPLTNLVGCGVYGAKTTPEFDIDFH